MDEVARTLLRQARNLPVLDRFELWEALSHALFDEALNAEGAFVERPVMTLDERAAALEEAAVSLERAAATASRVSRSADATMHALAARHHTVHRERDDIEWESMGDRDYPLTPGEFAAAALGPALGVSSSHAEAMAADAERIRHCLRPLFEQADAGRARMSSVVKISDVLAHLDDAQIAVALPHLIHAKAATAGSTAANNRTSRVLDALGLTEDEDEIDIRAQLGVWFAPHPEHPTLTELRAVLPARDAADLKAAIHSHAQELRDSAPHVLDVALREPINALRADALVLLALANVHVTPVLHLQVPVVRSRPSVAGGAEAVERVTHTSGPTLDGSASRVSVLDADGVWSGRSGPGWPDAARASERVWNRHSGSGGPDSTREASGVWTRRPGSGGPNAARLSEGFGGVGPPSGADGVPLRGGVGEHSSTNGFGDARVPGVGTIVAAVVEELARVVGAVFTTELMDAERWTTIATSTQKYRLSTAIRTFVERRDVHCRFPWCSRRAEGCDADHVVPFADGGETSAANLQMLCRHHHRAKTFGGWAVQMNADGVCTWQSPSGPMMLTHPNDAVPRDPDDQSFTVDLDRAAWPLAAGPAALEATRPAESAPAG